MKAVGFGSSCGATDHLSSYVQVTYISCSYLYIYYLYSLSVYCVNICVYWCKMKVIDFDFESLHHRPPLFIRAGDQLYIYIYCSYPYAVLVFSLMYVYICLCIGLRCKVIDFYSSCFTTDHLSSYVQVTNYIYIYILFLSTCSTRFLSDVRLYLFMYWFKM